MWCETQKLWGFALPKRGHIIKSLLVSHSAITFVFCVVFLNSLCDAGKIKKDKNAFMLSELSHYQDEAEFALYFKYPSAHGATNGDNDELETISPWHDVPLLAIPGPEENRTYHFVCTSPKGTIAKMAIRKDEHYNPIKQDRDVDKESGQSYLRYYEYNPERGLLYNYGSFPQTWGDPSEEFSPTKTRGDDDPLDVIELSEKPCKSGEVREVIVVGGFLVIENQKTDWKVLVVNVKDGRDIMGEDKVNPKFFDKNGGESSSPFPRSNSLIINQWLRSERGRKKFKEITLWFQNYNKSGVPNEIWPTIDFPLSVFELSRTIMTQHFSWRKYTKQRNIKVRWFNQEYVVPINEKKGIISRFVRSFMIFSSVLFIAFCFGLFFFPANLFNFLDVFDGIFNKSDDFYDGYGYGYD